MSTHDPRVDVYIDWIAEAKTGATRQERLATTLESLAEGKRRNWKYEAC